MMKLLILVFGLYSFSLQATEYVSIIVGNSKLLADNQELDGAFKGPSFGIRGGYRFLFVDLEMAIIKNDIDGKVSQSAFEPTASSNNTLSISMKDTMKTIGLRVHMFFLNIQGGYAFHDLETKVIFNEIDISSNSAYDSINGDERGAYWGVGLEVPLANISVTADFIVYKLPTTAYGNGYIGIRYSL
jgi:hypothetical protein